MSPELIAILNATLEEAPALVANKAENAEESEDDLLDEYLDKLRFFFDDNLLLAALDLVDRQNVIKFKVPWGHAQYEVLGTSAAYATFPGDYSAKAHIVPPYCTCASFAFSTLVSGAQFMCKHALAVILAERMSRCIERPVSPDDVAAMFCQKAGLSRK